MAGKLAFPKPKHKKRVNDVRRNATRSRARMIRDLDAIARQEVFERDGSTCVRCSIVERDVQWAHIFSRRHLCLRWESMNALSLCGGCHLWWHHEPLLAVDWFRKNWPYRYEAIIAVIKFNPKISVRELWEARCQTR